MCHFDDNRFGSTILKCEPRVCVCVGISSVVFVLWYSIQVDSTTKHCYKCLLNWTWKRIHKDMDSLYVRAWYLFYFSHRQSEIVINVHTMGTTTKQKNTHTPRTNGNTHKTEAKIEYMRINVCGIFRFNWHIKARRFRVFKCAIVSGKTIAISMRFSFVFVSVALFVCSFVCLVCKWNQYAPAANVLLYAVFSLFVLDSKIPSCVLTNLVEKPLKMVPFLLWLKQTNKKMRGRERTKNGIKNEIAIWFYFQSQAAFFLLSFFFDLNCSMHCEYSMCDAVLFLQT